MGFYKRIIEARQTARRQQAAAALLKKHQDAFVCGRVCCLHVSVSAGGVPYMVKISDLLSLSRQTEPSCAAADTEMAARYPCLYSLLTTMVHENGKSRRPSTILLLAEGGVWKGCLTDKDTAQSLWVSSDRLQDLLGALEAALGLRPVPWKRAWTPPSRGGQGGVR